MALLSQALAIGLNIAVFSAINGVRLRPLPYKDPERQNRVEPAFGKPASSQGGSIDPAGQSPANPRLPLTVLILNPAFEVAPIYRPAFRGCAPY